MYLQKKIANCINLQLAIRISKITLYGHALPPNGHLGRFSDYRKKKLFTQTGGRTDGRTDGRTGRLTDRQKERDGQTDGRTDLF